MKTTDHNPIPASLIKAIRWLFQPLVRLLIEKGVIYPLLRDLLKEIYVEVAVQDFTLQGKSPSDSRIFILTGVHRKSIKQLRDPAAQTGGTTNSSSTLGGAIVSRWLGLPEYQSETGHPRCLPRATENNKPGFDALVTSVNTDVRPRAILDEWVRLGMVVVDDTGAICLNKSAFIPQEDFKEQAFFLGRNVHDHLAACVHNMQQSGPPMLERSVYFSCLTEDSVARLRSLAQQHGMNLLQMLNKQALELQSTDKDKLKATYRMRFGCYWYQENKSTTGESR